MERSTSRWRKGVRLGAGGIIIAVILWDGSALAINAIVSQDLPILTEMAATEAKSYFQLGGILGEATAIVKEAKEYTTIAKTAWGALNELRQMSLDDLKRAALTGLGNAFPEVAQMYGDIKDIS